MTRYLDPFGVLYEGDKRRKASYMALQTALRGFNKDKYPKGLAYTAPSVIPHYHFLTTETAGLSRLTLVALEAQLFLHKALAQPGAHRV